MPDIAAIREDLFHLLREKGARLTGVADLTGVAGSEMPVGISVAVPVPKGIVRDLQTAPTQEYYEAYHAMNAQLNEIVSVGAEFLRAQGFRARANTTLAVKQDSQWRTPLPHKTVATRAGLGWIGKSCLLVTPEFGSAVRLSSLLTDAPLPADAPVDESRCGSCSLCVDRCPAHALTGRLWSPGVGREEIFRREDCKRTQVERMKAATGREVDLCGLCFAVCPYTQKYLKRK